ncbi:FIMAH domain-containing protein [Paenibacillus mesophilus]|uniref:FIMAH domain-containing protein n=1 Tax=Paenibacillus mesophilus TaxID=2582849 RepID=UPI00130514B1|nr:PQQ-binding-like beta-propeller repeat protein [Paenibacillus mesophilus]
MNAAKLAKWALLSVLVFSLSISCMWTSGPAVAAAASITVSNAGFEQAVQNGEIPGWQRIFNSNDPSATYGISDTVAYEGQRSLRLDDMSGSASVAIESDRFPVVGGLAYTAKAMLKVDRDRLAIYIRFFDAAGTKITDAQSWYGVSNGEWFAGIVSGIAPEQAVTGTVLFYSSGKEKGAGNVDRVELEEKKMGSFVDLGVAQHSVVNHDSAVGKDGQGRDVIYEVINGSDGKSFFTVIDVMTSQVLRSIDMPGASGAWGVTAASDGTVYVGTHFNGHLYRYVPADGSLTDLGRLGEETHIWAIEAGPDGKVYAGTYPNAHVFEYAPASQTIRDLGRAHPTEKYVKSLAYDSERGVLYAGVGGVNAELVRIDPVSGAKQNMLSQLLPQSGESFTFVNRLGYATGKLFIKLSPDRLLIMDAATETVEYYNPSGRGMGSQDVAVMPGNEQHIYFGGALLRYYDTATKTIRETALRAADFQDGQFVQLNDPLWPGYTLVAPAAFGKYFLYNPSTGNSLFTEVRDAGEPVALQSLHAAPDGHLYGGGYMDGLNIYDPQTQLFEKVSETPMSGIESVLRFNDKIYIGKYQGSRLYEYDPDEPWVEGINPRKKVDLTSRKLDRPFALRGVEDQNRIYIGSVADYANHSGGLSVYDVSTSQVQVYRDIVANQGVVSIVYQDGLVYGGTSIYGGLGTPGPIESEGKLFIFDTSTDTKTFETVPVPGRKVVSGLLNGPDGMIWGVAEDTIFKFDPQTKQVVYKAAKLGRYGTGTVWVDAFLELGTDGNVYGTNRQKTFFTIDPNTMEFTVIKNGAGNYLTQDAYGNLYMADDANVWKYSLPVDESTISAFIQRSADAGQLPHPVQVQLTNSLRQAVHQYGEGHRDQAVKHLRDFLKHLHNEAAEPSVKLEVIWPLDQQVRTLIAEWDPSAN